MTSVITVYRLTSGHQVIPFLILDYIKSFYNSLSTYTDFTSVGSLVLTGSSDSNSDAHQS